MEFLGQTDCICCLEKLGNGKSVYAPGFETTEGHTSTCRHLFHLSCLKKWCVKCPTRPKPHGKELQDCPVCPLCKVKIQYLLPARRNKEIWGTEVKRDRVGIRTPTRVEVQDVDGSIRFDVIPMITYQDKITFFIDMAMDSNPLAEAIEDAVAATPDVQNNEGAAALENHTEEAVIYSLPPGVAPNQFCNVCNRTFSFRSTCYNHMKIHKKERLNCEKCGYSTPYNMNFNRHKRGCV